MVTIVQTGTDANDTLTAVEGDTLILGLQGYDILQGGAGHDTLDGGGWADVLIGGTGGGLLLGGEGNDTLYAAVNVGAGAATLSGGLGDDVFRPRTDLPAGSTGITVLEFAPAFGRDVVDLGANPYVIRMAQGISASDVELVSPRHSIASGGGIVNPSHDWAWEIRFKNSSDVLRVQSPRDVGDGPSPLDGLAGLQGIEVADGTQSSPLQVLQELRKIDNAIYGVYGSSANDLIVGNAQDHGLYGFGGSDTLVSGSGSELMSGGEGVNVYRFAPGWGHDVIEARPPTVDLKSDVVVEFAAGVLPQSLSVRQSGSDLLLVSDDGVSSLRVNGFDSMGRSPFAVSSVEVRFADGSSWSNAQLYRQAFGIGTDRADTLWGTTAPEILDAGGGGDVIHGIGGMDTLLGGDGHDRISAGGDGDVLQGGRGIDTLDLDVSIIGTTDKDHDPRLVRRQRHPRREVHGRRWQGHEPHQGQRPGVGHVCLRAAGAGADHAVAVYCHGADQGAGQQLGLIPSRHH